MKRVDEGGMINFDNGKLQRPYILYMRLLQPDRKK